MFCCFARGSFSLIELITFLLLLLLQKITVAECIETQSKAMTMLTIDQLSYLLKFALQKIKQPGVSLVKKNVLYVDLIGVLYSEVYQSVL